MTKRIQLYLIFLLLPLFAIGQTRSIKIKNAKGIEIGKFDISLFYKKAGLLKKVEGFTISDFDGDEVGLRLSNLKWEDKEQTGELRIRSNDVKLEGGSQSPLPQNSTADYLLSTGKDKEDISFNLKDLKKEETFTFTIEDASIDREKIQSLPKQQFTIIPKQKELPASKEQENDVNEIISKEVEKEVSTEEVIGPLEEKINPEETQKDTIKQDAVVIKEADPIDEKAELAWKQIDKRYLWGFRDFIKKFKNSEFKNTKDYISTSYRILEDLDEAHWKKYKREKRYDKYLKKYENKIPEGKYVKEAKELQSKKGKAAKKDDEEIAWDKTDIEGATKENYEAFLKKYPSGRFSESAKEMLLRGEEIQYTINEKLTTQGRTYTIKFKNVVSPSIISSFSANQVIVDDSDLANLHKLRLTLENQDEYTFVISDVAFSDRKKTIPIDNKFTFDLNMPSKQKYEFHIKKGIPPYRIDFLHPDESVAQKNAQFVVNSLPEDGTFSILVENMQAQGMAGNYNRVQIFDGTKTRNVEKEIVLEVEESSQSLLLILIPLLLLLGIGAFMYYNKKKRQEVEAKYKEHQHEIEVNMLKEKAVKSTKEPEKTAPVAQNKSKQKFTIKKSQRELQPDAPPPDKSKKINSGKMKIKWKQEQNGLMTEKAFIDFTANPNFHQKQLTEHWDNTTITDVFLGKECIADLGLFLKEENLDRVKEEQLGTIPEVGGFLMGNYAKDEKSGQYQVSISKFVPFVPEYHDVYKIEIGTATLVKELADAQDQNPSMAVIGWFHTHPGHGLFLSNPDLAVQRHFPQPYQIAMEIDSLTARLDTAFFTRQKEGAMNNSQLRKSKNWFAWTNIDPKAKKSKKNKK